MKVFFVSLGCDKNKVDSEKILKLFLKNKKMSITLDPLDADIAIVNTCSFIRDAKKESIDYLKYLISLKKKGKLSKIMMLGCLATECHKLSYDEILRDLYKDIDLILPLDKYIIGLDNVNDRVSDILSFSSFIKICDGCDKYCTYCIIPYLRGKFRSNATENIISETKKLAANGVKELSIVGQDTLSYGKDLYGKKKFPELIDKVSKVDGIEWIRLLYCYPEEIDDEVINLIRNNKKVLPYIDMPIQHASDKVLKSMNRKTTKESIRNVVHKLRNEIPEIVIRTTILVGFPGESESDFKELCDFVKEMRFDKLGVFCYSREQMSKSYNMKGQIPDNVKKKRQKILMQIQKKIAIEKNKEKLGYVYTALVEGYDRKNKVYVARPYFDARDIDDKVYVKTKENLISGDFINVEIKKVRGLDLEGSLV